MSHTCVLRVQKQKTRVASNHEMHHTHMHLPIQNICHKTILLITSSALSFIIYACRTILGGMVTDILGHPRHTAFVATCS